MSEATPTVRVLLELIAQNFARDLEAERAHVEEAVAGMQAAAENAGDGVEAAFAQLGVRPSEQIQAEVQSLEQAFEVLHASGTVSLEDLARAQEALGERTATLNAELGGTSEVLGETADSAEETGTRLSNFASSLLSLDVLARGFEWLSEQVGDLAELADAWANLKASIDLVTDSETEAAGVLERVQVIAQDAAAELGATGALYTTLARALKSLRDEETSAAELTRTITETFQISGASASESGGAIRQLSQALASGVLRGDEFNSVMEQAPRLAQALADSLGVTTGQLRAMAEAGELTAETVIAALREQADQIAAEAATLPETFERSTTRFVNSLTAVVGGLNEALHASELYARGSELLARGIALLAAGVETIGDGLVLIARLFGMVPAPVYAAIAAMAAMAAGVALLSANLALVVGYLGSLATGLTLIALAAMQSFVAQIAAAGQALAALWGVMLANPLTALAAGLAIVAAGMWAYREAAKETIETVRSLREELAGQIDEVETLQHTLATAAPDSEEFAGAQQRLAQIVPGLTLDLDEQGRIVARLGEGYEANAKKVAAYTESLRQQDFAALTRQLGLQYEAYQEAGEAAEEYRASLERNYGASAQTRGALQQMRLALGRLDGGWERVNARADTLNARLRAQEAAWRQVAIEALGSGRSLSEISTALADAGRSSTEIETIIEALRGLQSEAQKALEGLSTEQRKVAQTAREAVEQVEGALNAVESELERLDKSIATHLGAVSKAQNTENEGWNRVGESLRAAYQDRLGDIDAFVAERRQAIARTETDERTSASRLSELQRQANAERLDALRTYEQEAQWLLDEEQRRRLEVARRSGQAEHEINIGMLASRRATLEQIAAAYRAHVDQLNAEANRHLEAVKSVDAQLRQLEMSGDELVRELRRGAMSEYEAYQDRRRELAHLTSQTEQALTRGDYQLAQELAQKQIALARQQAAEVQDGDRVVISKEEGTRTAIRATEVALAQKKRALEAVREEHVREAQAASEAGEDAQDAYAKVRQELEGLAQELDRELEIKLRLDREALDEELKTLAEELAERTVLVQAKGDLEGLQETLNDANTWVRDHPVRLQITLDRARKQLEDLSGYAQTLKPEIGANLKLSTDNAWLAIDGVRNALQTLEQPTESTHTVTDNADVVMAELDRLDGHDTSSVHTIYQRTVSGNAAGGLIHALALATGGAVFAPPAWETVPGVGNEDSVPAGLRAGSYVLNKQATRFYGAALLDQVARFASGGMVPAMLMPGERLFTPETVAHWGAGFFDSLNQMRLPPATLAGMAGLMAPVQRFATGGLAAQGGAAPVTEEVKIRLQQGKRTVTMRSSRAQAKALGALLQDLTSTV